MKKLFLSVILVAFAVSVNAEGDKACCPKKADAEAKAAVCPASGKQVKSQCPSGAKDVKAAKVNSPKGSEQAKR